MRPILLLDPYGRGRTLAIYADDVLDRAALAECRPAGHRLRWRFGEPAACADCWQDALRVTAGLGLLPDATARRPSLNALDGLVCIR